MPESAAQGSAGLLAGKRGLIMGIANDRSLAWGVARAAAAYEFAAQICDDDVGISEAIGRHGLELVQALAAKKQTGEPGNILTHCNAG